MYIISFVDLADIVDPGEETLLAWNGNFEKFIKLNQMMIFCLLSFNVHNSTHEETARASKFHSERMRIGSSQCIHKNFLNFLGKQHLFLKFYSILT